MLIVVGSVCSGKTTFGNVAKTLGYQVIEMGEEVNLLYNQSKSNKSIIDFVNEQFKLMGKDFIAKRVVKKINKNKIPLDELIIIGSRTIEEVEYFKTHLGHMNIITIHTDDQERWRRLNLSLFDPIVSNLTYREFINRNITEDGWGLSSIKSNNDFILFNEGSREEYLSKIKEYLLNIKDNKILISKDIKEYEKSPSLTSGITLLDRFEIIKLLGKGQSKETWMAIDLDLGKRVVAIKKLHIDKEIQELKKEAFIAGKLEHKNIARIYDINDEFGFIIEEYIEGHDLEKYLNSIFIEYKTLHISESVTIFNELLEAICYAHSQNRIHGDIKPGNILIPIKVETVKIKLTDFGVGKILTDAMTEDNHKLVMEYKLGSLNYAAPEVLRGEQKTKQTDLFSLGIVAYILFSGRHPFLHPSGQLEIKELILSETYKPESVLNYNSSLPMKIDHIISKLLEKETKNRYLSASDVLDDFHAIAW